jgi:hypothetical protein
MTEKLYQHRPSHGPAGAQPNYREVHDTSHSAHQARGHMSPLAKGSAYGAPGSAQVRRDEDIASAPAQRGPLGQTPFPTNTRGGVTQVTGAHGPVGTPRDRGNG